MMTLSPSPILGSVSTFKTFMRGHLCVNIYAWTFMRGERVIYVILHFLIFYFCELHFMAEPKADLEPAH